MKGAPLVRTFLLLLVLVATGFGFAKLTQPRASLVTVSDPTAQTKPLDIFDSTYYLDFSAAYRSAEIQAGSETTAFNDGALRQKGTFPISGKSIPIFLKVEWSEKSASPRFVKLAVEAPSQKTFVHFFEGAGDIDDFIELPF